MTDLFGWQKPGENPDYPGNPVPDALRFNPETRKPGHSGKNPEVPGFPIRNEPEPQRRQRKGGKENETAKLRAEMGSLLAVIAEWEPIARELDRISDGYRSHFDAAHDACVRVVRDLGHPPYTDLTHSEQFQAAYRARLMAGCAWHPHRKAAQDAARYLKEVKKRMAEIKEELAP